MGTRLNINNTNASFDFNEFCQNPIPFYTIMKNIFMPVINGKIKPSVCHYFVKLLDDKRLLLRNYTQNIDTLDKIAGIPSEKLVESHGSLSSAHCINCRKPLPDMKQFWIDIKNDITPTCNYCSNYIRPDIVFFGEGLPAEFQKNKFEDMNECDLLIVMGTSLKVYPFAGLVSEPDVKVPRVLINKESVSVWRRVTGEEERSSIGNYRDVAFIGDCDKGVLELVKYLGWEDEMNQLMK